MNKNFKLALIIIASCLVLETLYMVIADSQNMGELNWLIIFTSLISFCGFVYSFFSRNKEIDLSDEKIYPVTTAVKTANVVFTIVLIMVAVVVIYLFLYIVSYK